MMCGYVQNNTSTTGYKKLVYDLGLGDFYDQLAPDGGGISRFYPAFGGDSRKKIKGLIIAPDSRVDVVDATWWFDCHEEASGLVVGKRTTFNARNLESPFWKGALRHHRGIVIANGIGESRKYDGKPRRFLMTSEKPFILGALYRRFPSGNCSCAIITRDAHPKFEPYHDKAFPLFLPADKSFIDDWLLGCGDVSDDIQELLDHPRLFPDLNVQQVRTYKGGEPIGKMVSLEADLSI